MEDSVNFYKDKKGVNFNFMVFFIIYYIKIDMKNIDSEFIKNINIYFMIDKYKY